MRRPTYLIIALVLPLFLSVSPRPLPSSSLPPAVTPTPGPVQMLITPIERRQQPEQDPDEAIINIATVPKPVTKTATKIRTRTKTQTRVRVKTRTKMRTRTMTFMQTQTQIQTQTQMKTQTVTLVAQPTVVPVPDNGNEDWDGYDDDPDFEWDAVSEASSKKEEKKDKDNGGGNGSGKSDDGSVDEDADMEECNEDEEKDVDEDPNIVAAASPSSGQSPSPSTATAASNSTPSVQSYQSNQENQEVEENGYRIFFSPPKNGGNGAMQYHVSAAAATTTPSATVLPNSDAQPRPLIAPQPDVGLNVDSMPSMIKNVPPSPSTLVSEPVPTFTFAPTSLNVDPTVDADVEPTPSPTLDTPNSNSQAPLNVLGLITITKTKTVTSTSTVNVQGVQTALTVQEADSNTESGVLLSSVAPMQTLDSNAVPTVMGAVSVSRLDVGSSSSSSMDVPSPTSSMSAESVNEQEKEKEKTTVKSGGPILTLTRTMTAMALPTPTSSSASSSIASVASAQDTSVAALSVSSTSSTSSSSSPSSASVAALSVSTSSSASISAASVPASASAPAPTSSTISANSKSKSKSKSDDKASAKDDDDKDKGNNDSDGKAKKKHPSGGPLVASYYPDWTTDVLPPEKVDFERLDWVDYAFAIPTEKYGLAFTDSKSEDTLKTLVGLAHEKGKFVKLSIGGWTGSSIFSQAVATDGSRKTFVSAITDMYQKFNLDGIDIDWEYPGTEGAPGNAFTSSDSAHFLLFLQSLRAALPKDAVITAATQVWPFAGKDGKPMVDVSAFAKVIDWVLLMNYDVWGSSSKPGPNAPLTDACRNSTQPLANAQAAIQSWNEAGFPLDQLTLGVPAYGYISKSSVTRLSQRSLGLSNGNDIGVRSPPGSGFDSNSNSNVKSQPKTKPKTTTKPPSHILRPPMFKPPHFQRPFVNSRITKMRRDAVTVQNDSGGSNDGQIQFRDMVKQGALKQQDGNWVGANGFQRFWDDCSSTPFLRSESAQQIITYDDPKSMEMKGRLAKEAKILGVNMWDAHGDTEDWQLIDAVRKGLGV